MDPLVSTTRTTALTGESPPVAAPVRTAARSEVELHCAGRGLDAADDETHRLDGGGARRAGRQEDRAGHQRQADERRGDPRRPAHRPPAMNVDVGSVMPWA